MPLGLSYRINEGMGISEDTGDGHQESVEVIVRDVVLFPEGVNVDFELRDFNGSSKLSLCEDEGYNVTPHCILYVPVHPLRGGGLSREDRIFLKFYAPREVEFGKRKRYD